MNNGNNKGFALKRSVAMLLVVCIMSAALLPFTSLVSHADGLDVSVDTHVHNASASIPTNALVVNAAGGTTYSIFNSGATTSGGYEKYKDPNPAPATHNNNGYDLYGYVYKNSGTNRVRMGLSFYVDIDITEKANLSVKAWDVDESTKGCSYGYEWDYVYLVDETTGTATKLTPYLSGQDNTWNTSRLTLAPSLFTKGHVYHFELQMTCSGHTNCSFYSVTVRSVDLTINGSGDGAPVTPTTGIESADVTASISSSRYVSTALTAKAYKSANYRLEYKAVSLSNNAQYGGTTSTMTIGQTPTTGNIGFYLDSNAPRGTYEITVFIVDSSTGNVVATRSAIASYGYVAVSYNSNGGSQNVPVDSTAYSNGNTVNVKFDYIPSLYGYNFLGWSTDKYATVPTYTKDGVNTFTIGSSDVTLYAVWAPDVCEHSWIEGEFSYSETCTRNGLRTGYCEYCNETLHEIIPSTGHDYKMIDIEYATCTEDGFILSKCENCFAIKRQTVQRLEHDIADGKCARCDFTVTDHTHEYNSKIVEATCKSMGYTEYTCFCGYGYRDSIVEPHPHDWNEGYVEYEATCEMDGLKIYYCKNCEAHKDIILPAEHDWIEEVTAEKTCTADGSVTKTCDACGASETVVIPAGHTFDEGLATEDAYCEIPGSKLCTCLECQATEVVEIPVLGHAYRDGICERCGERFIDNVTVSEHPIYGMYFELDAILSDYGPSLVDEYGLLLDYNKDAVIEKVAVYLVQDGTMWRRCIAVKGTNIQYATYVPYLSYQSDIKYTGINHEWINTFPLAENSDGIWCYSSYATIGVNLQDAYGNLLLSVYDIGEAGAKTRIFDDLDEMIAWLKGECDGHVEGDWEVVLEPSCYAGMKQKSCTKCQTVLESEEIAPTEDHALSDWYQDQNPAADRTGYMYQKCTLCDKVINTVVTPVVPTISVKYGAVSAGHTLRVTVDMTNNPGILGATLSFEYDGEGLVLVGYENGTAWGNLSLTAPSDFSSGCVFVWDGVGEASASDGAVIVLIFEVSADADYGSTYAINVKYEDGNLVDENLAPVFANISLGLVEVTNSYRDVNMDGVFDIADIVTLRRYLAGGNEGEMSIDTEAADANGDGNINVADVILLRSELCWQ